MEHPYYVGCRIREERKRLKLSQETLASELNISVNYLGELERGKREVNLNMAKKLCLYFHITLDYLCWGIPSSRQTEPLLPEVDPQKELLSLIKTCTEQELHLCLNLLKLVLVYRHSNRK